MKIRDRVMIFGGTGSLGKVLTKRFLDLGCQVCVVSRDEEKHRAIQSLFPKVKSFIADMRDYSSLLQALMYFKPNCIINAAALKQVPICENQPFEATLTNVIGSQNLCRAVDTFQSSRFGHFITFLSVSTDKAAAPSTAYGMTKALQERIHLSYSVSSTINSCVRYGNVLESRGSIIPVFKEKIRLGEELTITDIRMSRFLLSLNQAVDLILSALEDNFGQKIFIPVVKSAYMQDLAECFIDHYKVKTKIKYTGIRPAEKLDEILFSQEEIPRVQRLSNKIVIHDINSSVVFNDFNKEYSSGHKENLMDKKELLEFFKEHGVL